MRDLFDLHDLPDRPQDGYAVLKVRATAAAGAPGEIPRRVMLHHRVYRDSGGHHAFPLVALHGAAWAAGFFETTGRLGQALRARYFYSRQQRELRMMMLNGFAEGFKIVNRQVCIDTCTNYLYTRHYGDRTDAGGMMHPDLFEALTAMHAAARSGGGLTPSRKRELFSRSLLHEQEVTVAPGVQAEIAKFDCPVLRALCLRPLVRFLYFPRGVYLLFRNFGDKQERIAKAMRSFDLAARVGWPHTEAALRTSPLLTPECWRDADAGARRAP